MATQQADNEGMPDGDATGGRVIAIAPQTLRWAADTLVDTLPPDMLKKLKIASGEHLATILTTTFLHVPPTGVDVNGGVDLWFDLTQEALNGREPASVVPPGTTSAAFEIKSMPGKFREYESGLNRDERRGIDTTGRAHTTAVRETNDVLREAVPTLLRARDQLQRKTSADISRNIFLVMHPFDHFPVDWMQPVLGPLLDPLSEIDGVDTVWILWPLERLTMWSSETQDWTDLLFNIVADPDEPSDDDGEGVLHDAEDYFLYRSGHTGGSPYLFHLSAGEGSPDVGSE